MRKHRKRALPSLAGTAALLLLGTALSLAQTPAPESRPRERFDNAEVQYGWVDNQLGDRLRTFITKPRHSAGRVPAIFFVGWLSCDSVEYPRGETDGFGALIRRLIEESGYATVRMDKPGVGESRGTACEKADFQRELEGYRAAFDAMKEVPFIDHEKLFVVGISNGGGVAPLVARRVSVKGFISLGSWGRTWYEHMLDAERKRLASEGKSPGEINDAVKVFAQFYGEYLMGGKTPGEVLRAHPQWKGLWYGSADGQYGRPAAFYQQLQFANLGQAWENVQAPVLVIRGAEDEYMSRADSEAIVESVNRPRPGQARYLEIPGMNHDLSIGGKFNADLVPLLMSWMKDRLSESGFQGRTLPPGSRLDPAVRIGRR